MSGQHLAWLIPLIETGWIAYISTTDAVCYHDGHRSLDAHKHGPIHEVPIFTDDAALREERTIRVTDMAFDEDVFWIRIVFCRRCQAAGVSKKMTGTELRYLLGAYYDAQEQQNGVPSGLCQRATDGDSGLCRGSGRWKRIPEFHEALGHATRRYRQRIRV